MTVRVPPTVIVAEIYPLARVTLAALLSDDGYKVFQAENAESAFALIERLPDLAVLLTDLGMTNWRSVVKRAAENTRAIIIAMDGEHQHSVNDLKTRGISKCVKKPVVYKDLLVLMKHGEV